MERVSDELRASETLPRQLHRLSSRHLRPASLLHRFHGTNIHGDAMDLPRVSGGLPLHDRRIWIRGVGGVTRLGVHVWTCCLRVGVDNRCDCGIEVDSTKEWRAERL